MNRALSQTRIHIALNITKEKTSLVSSRV
nr:hypothetical protein [Streptococcus pyogenes]